MKTITRAEELQLIGLAALAANHTKQLEGISGAIKAIIGDDDDSGDISDVLYADRDIAWLLERRGITVAESEA